MKNSKIGYWDLFAV